MDTSTSLIFFILLTSGFQTKAEISDADQASESDTSGTADMDMKLDNKDPNLLDPKLRQGYGFSNRNPKISTHSTTTTRRPTIMKTTSAPLTIGEESLTAALQLGVVVSKIVMKFEGVKEFDKKISFT